MTDDAVILEYELRFLPLEGSGGGYRFPCDARGRVDLDALGERARTNYLFARGLVGRILAPPTVQARTSR